MTSMGNSNEGVKASWKRGRTRDSIKTIFGQDLGGSKSSSPQELMQELIHVIIRIFRNLFFDFCFQHIPILQGFTNRLVLKFKKNRSKSWSKGFATNFLRIYIIYKWWHKILNSFLNWKIIKNSDGIDFFDVQPSKMKPLLDPSKKRSPQSYCENWLSGF